MVMIFIFDYVTVQTENNDPTRYREIRLEQFFCRLSSKVGNNNTLHPFKVRIRNVFFSTEFVRVIPNV